MGQHRALMQPLSAVLRPLVHWQTIDLIDEVGPDRPLLWQQR
jgi:hypothetical protein